jgi:hypothetical protein
VKKNNSKPYIFLDGAAERKTLILSVTALRRQMYNLTEHIPQADWYTPRYGAWSLAGVLGHLNFHDSMSLTAIRMALIGLRPATSLKMLQRVNRITVRVFRSRVIETSLQSMEQNEHRIIDFIMGLSMSKFTMRVWDPRYQQFLTIEKAIQDFWVFHWSHHIEQIQVAEGITPPSQSDGT